MNNPLSQPGANGGGATPRAEEPSPGAMLAQRRAAAGMALADVANRLKFAPRQIEALEADDYAKLPGPTFVRGMIRGYARLLEMDPGPMIQALERRHMPPPPMSVEMHSESIPFPDGRTRSTRVYLVLSALIVLAVGAVLYEWHFGVPQIIAGNPAPAEPTPAAAGGTPAVAAAVAELPAATADSAQPPSEPLQAGAAAASGSAAPSDAARIQLEFQQLSWVEVRDRAGKVLTSQLNPGGSRRTVEGDPPFALVIGNAPHVHMTYKDQPVDLKPHIKAKDVARLRLD